MTLPELQQKKADLEAALFKTKTELAAVKKAIAVQTKATEKVKELLGPPSDPPKPE